MIAEELVGQLRADIGHDRTARRRALGTAKRLAEAAEVIADDLSQGVLGPHSPRR
jgi:hypothetical protein